MRCRCDRGLLPETHLVRAVPGNGSESQVVFDRFGRLLPGIRPKP